MSVSDWENVKENILPLKGGRDPSKLAMCTQQQKSANEDKIQQEKDQFEKELSEYKGEDPLDIWTRYVRWVQQSFIGGNMKKELIVLLERCTSMFVNSDKYRNDQRYMKLWIIYADMCRDPIEIFNYLETNKIGLTLSLFYEAKAIIYENKSNYQQADQAYQLGLKRQAQPIDRLKKRHDDFQRRMVVAMSKAAKDGAIPSLSIGGSVSSDSQSTPRAALGNLSTREVIGSERKSSSVLSASALGKSSSSSVTGEKRKAASSSFQIYDDESGVGEKVTTNSKFLAKSGKSATESIRWEELEPELNKHKENNLQPSRWADTKIVQKRQKSDSGPAFEIYCDVQNTSTVNDENNTSNAPPSPDKLSAYSRKNAVEQIQNNPLANHLKNSTLLSASSSSAASAPVASASQSAKKERIGYKKELFMVGNEEVSFEEIRAKNWQMKKQATTNSSNTGANRQQMAPPSPTMTYHSKEAFKQVMSWFHTPIDFETKAGQSVNQKPSIFGQQPSESSSQSTPSDEEQKLLDNQENIDPATQPNRPKVTNGDIVKKTMFSQDQTEEFVIYDRGDAVSTIDRIDQYIKQEEQAFEIYEDTSLPNSINNNQQAPPNTLTEKIKSSSAMFGQSQANAQSKGGLGFQIYQDENQPVSKPAAKANPLFGNNQGGGFTIFQDSAPVAADSKPKSGLGFQIYQDENQPTSKPAAKANPLFGNNQSSGFTIFQDPAPVTAAESKPKSNGLGFSIYTDEPTPAPKANPLFSNNGNGGGFTIFQDPAPAPKSEPVVTKPVQQPIPEKTEVIELRLVSDSGVAEPYNQENKSMLEAYVIQSLSMVETFADNSSSSLAKINTANNTLQLDSDFQVIVKGTLSTSSNSNKVLSVETTDCIPMVAKIKQIPSVWEFYVQGQLLARLSQTEANEKLIDKFLSFYSMHLYSDASVTLMEHVQSGTLHQLMSKLKSSGKTLEESLKVFLAIDLLRSIHAMHSENFIHGNISPHNIYLSLTADIDSNWNAANTGGWIENGFKIGGFTRSLDIEMYGPETNYVAPLEMFDDILPIEVLKQRSSWRYDIDYLAVASTIYFMLSDGQQLNASKLTKDSTTQRWKLNTSDLKPTLKISMWSDILEQLLNASNRFSLISLQQQLESFLQSKSTEIKRALRKLKIDCDS